jgi:uridine kinase
MHVVQVVGGPGSGKTTLVHKLLEDWPGTASLLRADRYLRDRQPDHGDDFFLVPTSIDWPLMLLHLELLETGSDVTMPLYDWQTGRRLTAERPTPSEQVVEASEWLIIEGLFYVPDIRSIRLFVDAPADVRRARFQSRQSSLSQQLGSAYDLVAEQAYQQHILPQRDHAEHVLDGRLDQDKLADHARRYLASRWPGWG